MHEVTLALAVLLGAGFLIAKLGQVFHLPSVTGYIVAGLLLGPTGFGLISTEALGSRLDHFTELALMLIAFGIGEHLELKRLKPIARSVASIGLGETTGAFLLVGLGSFFVATLTQVGEPGWQTMNYAVLALLLGAVSVATAPAATLHVMRELKAAGPLTSTLMAVVAADDGLAIMYFGVAISVAHQIVGGSGSILGAIAGSLSEIVFSLLLGVITGLLIDFVVHRLKRRDEMLTLGLALLLLCGELARVGHLSPLLAGMATGFTIINRDRRDVRVFRVINTFEPPIYVLFFTLAGVHLDLAALVAAGWVGLAYYVLRGLGKLFGANLGGRLADSPKSVQNYMGLALLPQAGVAIGLVFIIQGDTGLSMYSAIITPVVLAGVVLSELTGPVGARVAVTRAGETDRGDDDRIPVRPLADVEADTGFSRAKFRLVPWTWEKLNPALHPSGTVIFGAANQIYAPALARIATLLACYYGAQPLAVSVINKQALADRRKQRRQTKELFSLCDSEVKRLGAEFKTQTLYSDSVAKGLIEAARNNDTRAIVLGHPQNRTAQEFQRVVDAVGLAASCPVIMARLVGVLHTERILAAVTNQANLAVMDEVVRALAQVGNHSITMIQVVPAGSTRKEINVCEEELNAWAADKSFKCPFECRVVESEAPVNTILEEANRHDLLVMAATPTKGLTRLFFGSLAEDVAEESDKPMLMVYAPAGKPDRPDGV